MDNETENVTGNLGEGKMPEIIELSAINSSKTNRLIPKVFGEHVYIVWKGDKAHWIAKTETYKPLSYLSSNGLWIHLIAGSLMRVPAGDLMVLKSHIKRETINIITDDEAEKVIRSRRISMKEKLDIYNLVNDGSMDELKSLIPDETRQKLINAGVGDVEVDEKLMQKFVKFMKKERSPKKSKGKGKLTTRKIKME
jgi:hypothetical protein